MHVLGGFGGFIPEKSLFFQYYICNFTLVWTIIITITVFQKSIKLEQITQKQKKFAGLTTCIRSIKGHLVRFDAFQIIYMVIHYSA